MAVLYALCRLASSRPQAKVVLLACGAARLLTHMLPEWAATDRGALGSCTLGCCSWDMEMQGVASDQSTLAV